jgi:hypothetical protein
MQNVQLSVTEIICDGELQDGLLLAGRLLAV